MSLEQIAIMYQVAARGKSCENCAYKKDHLARGMICQLHDLITRPCRMCGMWQPVREKEVETVENQGELF